MSSQSQWIYGVHAISAMLQHKPHLVLNVAVLTSKHTHIVLQAEAQGIAVREVKARFFERRFEGQSHQSIAAEIKLNVEKNEQQLKKKIEAVETPLIMLLDQIQDPHNLGACLRNAAAAAVDAVVLPKNHCAQLSAVVHKAASGAAATLDIYRVGNLVRALSMLQQQGVWAMTTSDQGEKSIYAADLNGPLALVFGGEQSGVRNLLRKQCDVEVSIPMARSAVSSLNVSVAAGICLMQAYQQRLVLHQ